MADDCSCPPRPEDPAERRTCPRSGTHGSPVELNTLKALLTERALRRLKGSPHRFCADESCEVVYFNSSDQVFTVEDVRVPVWQKESFGARMICYCFGENEAGMLCEVGLSKAVERVRTHIAAGP